HRAFRELLHPELSLVHKTKIAKRFKGNILVAEDNEANQELMKIVLNRYGLSFDLAVNGKEAVEFYKQNRYDLIFMDEQMPIMNGTDAVLKIIEYEKQNKLHHTPISALTANVIKGNRERDLLNGFDAFLGKPLILKELERVFMTYLKPDLQSESSKNVVQLSRQKNKKIIGLDSEKLMRELMFNEDELIMLVTLFLNKMKNILTDLEKAIKTRDYKKIALLSHSIKGSSANFRIKLLQTSASEMEEMAKLKKRDYNYEKRFIEIKNKISSIRVRN
ncbi:MAG TPA: response regulator, partial [Sulfurimonas autotrophica]|nr:response regulator [Sulfurimonas autotrophica]